MAGNRRARSRRRQACHQEVGRRPSRPAPKVGASDDLDVAVTDVAGNARGGAQPCTPSTELGVGEPGKLRAQRPQRCHVVLVALDRGQQRRGNRGALGAECLHCPRTGLRVRRVRLLGGEQQAEHGDEEEADEGAMARACTGGWRACRPSSAPRGSHRVLVAVCCGRLSPAPMGGGRRLYRRDRALLEVRAQDEGPATRA